MERDEIELKLALDQKGLERLRRLPLLAAHRQGRPATRQLTSTYFDTPDFALARAGITVRVRSVGRKRLQTVKTAGSRVAGLFARREWEAQIATDRPDGVLLSATGLPALLDGTILDNLDAVFSTRIRRTTHILAGEGWRVEAAVDTGEVQAGPHREPIHEIELELLEGAPSHLFDLARSIADGVPTRLTALSKSDRGYQLAVGAAPVPVKSRPVAVSSDMKVADAFRAIARNCLDHLLANERCLLATRNGEAIHQMRVALRRLRSAIKVFRPILDGPQLDRIRGRLRWLLDHLGPARDNDVFLTEIVDPVVRRYAGNPALAKLREQWFKLREDDLSMALTAVADPEFTAMLLEIGAWVEAGDWLGSGRAALAKPLGPFAATILTKRDKRLRKAGGKDLTRLPADELHMVRILGKQLRYAGEFFAPLHPGGTTKTFLAGLAELQDALGHLNDIAVAAPKLDSTRNQGDGAWAAGVVVGWHEARRPGLIEDADRAWRKYRKSRRFWT